ncbi:Myo-inositol-hexaphosphate 3-phosphohydrolase A [Hyphodiscus hymeniophilus]|uniref:Myo-inositol-hexaphosphate 3-phosphohydrolase A n=1 Tax=Hyphodiscus hymeniophilus TaxID=353542 RepID=A0A9P6VDU4_9HELO|nr:Myo-inositol-hexaphosphate 3-phosphohydrolase A [Hyphodiscus hymeniophilus]
MLSSSIGIALLLSAISVSAQVNLLTDINQISRSWGQVSVYADNEEDYFGVEYVGLPDGCQIESASTLQRHAQRFPTSYIDDGVNDQQFADKLSNFTKAASGNSSVGLFTGPLSFLNGYQYIMQDTGLLTGIGAITEFQSGVSFWNRYGRTLFNASLAQLAYNSTIDNGTARPPVVIRTTSQSRIQNTQISWSLGFFGPSFRTIASPTLANWTAPFERVVIPEGGTENNTLASYDSCFNDYSALGYMGDDDIFTYLPKYLGAATKRMQKYAPSGFSFNYNDTYAMQSICAYEYNYIGMSDFCFLFTADEWAGFENTLDMEYYYDYSYGNPTGRAQGIGYLQELIARLEHVYITSSNSSVNSTIDNNAATFPLGQPFYADFSHDDIIISVLTAMSMDYFKDPPSLSQYPPNPNRHFNLANLTPFGARLITETIGCSVPDPAPVKDFRTQYTPTQYGYDADNATYKFIRMRLNNGVLPLNTIRGGGCGTANDGRVDGMCELSAFIASQATAYELSNYDFACFGNYTIANLTSGQDYDGAATMASY